jgi:DNA-binding CsgD family transcriptional regulator/tetratricopeptide (TPR) repeat protein
MAALAFDTPLVGRVAELSSIVDGIGRQPDAAFIVVGPPGSGKTRLASEVAEMLAPQRYTALRVVASKAMAAIPFGAFAVCLPDLNVGGAPATTLQQATDVITAMSSDRSSLLLVVDDAQMLDDGSAALLHHLVHERVCATVVTLRTPAQCPDAVTRLWKDQLAERISLAPLTSEEVEELAVDGLGGPVAAATARWLHDSSQGNPMYVRELLIGAAARGGLEQVDGLWMVRSSFPAPERLVELVAARLEDVSAEAVEVLDALCIGEPLSYKLLTSIAGAAGVEEAERHGLISRYEGTGPAVAGVSHPLFAEARRQAMPYATLRRLSQLLVENFPRAEEPTADELIRLARWHLDSETVADPELLTEAAAAARAGFDHDLAARFAEAALEAGGGPMAGLTLGEAYFFSGRHQDAERVLAETAERDMSEADFAKVAHARAYNLGTLIGDRARAEAVLSEAATRVGDPVGRMRLVQSVTNLRVLAGEPNPTFHDALELMRSTDDGIAHRGTQFAAIAAAYLGRADEALAIGEHGFELHRALTRTTQRPASQLVGPVLALLALGRLDEADQMAATCRDAADATAKDETVATFGLLGGMVAVEQGLAGEAERLFREALAANRQVDDPGAVRWCLGGLALACALNGEAAAAASHLADLDATPTHWMQMFELDLIERGRAWTHAVAGRLADAHDVLAAAADRAAQLERNVAEATLRHDLARLGKADLVADRLDELAERVDGDYVRTFALHARASLLKDRMALEDVADRFEKLGALLLAAEVGLTVATLYRDQSDSRGANKWDQQVDRLVRRCGAFRAPSLRWRGSSAKLTKREQEIVALAGSGASSKAIAERLGVSARTVETHLQNAYLKLGVKGRHELPEV